MKGGRRKRGIERGGGDRDGGSPPRYALREATRLLPAAIRMLDPQAQTWSLGMNAGTSGNRVSSTEWPRGRDHSLHIDTRQRRPTGPTWLQPHQAELAIRYNPGLIEAPPPTVRRCAAAAAARLRRLELWYPQHTARWRRRYKLRHALAVGDLTNFFTSST